MTNRVKQTAAETLGTMTELIETEEQLLNRRAKARENQKHYRAMQKLKMIASGERVKELKGEIYHSALYLAFIAQRDMLRPARRFELRLMAMELYSDYFQFGARPTSDFFTKQETFLSFQMSDQLTHPSLSTKGYKPLLQQWVMYTLLTGSVHLTKISVDSIDCDGSIIRLKQNISYTITPYLIAALYPHMLNDFSFKKQVIGKELSYEMIQVATFDSANRIVSLQLEHKLAQGWLKLVGDLILATQIVKDASINDHCYITTSLQHVYAITRY